MLTEASRRDWSSFVPISTMSGISFLEECKGWLKKTKLYVSENSPAENIARFVSPVSLVWIFAYTADGGFIPLLRAVKQATEMLPLPDKCIMMCLVPPTRWSSGASCLGTAPPPKKIPFPAGAGVDIHLA